MLSLLLKHINGQKVTHRDKNARSSMKNSSIYSGQFFCVNDYGTASSFFRAKITVSIQGIQSFLKAICKG
jgi:hypothetical protein